MSAFPGIAPALQYDREAVGHGAAWRALTGQIVHWSWEMAAVDLTLIVLAGSWIERGSRRAATMGIGVSLVAVAATIAFASPELSFYRGSSGVATALVALGATDVALRATAAVPRLLALSVLGALAAKIGLEWGGAGLLPGTLPHGVVVAAKVHAAGAAAGTLVAIALRFHSAPGTDARDGVSN